MDKENLHGRMVEGILAGMKMIKNMGMVNLYGGMEGSIKDFGNLENKMEGIFIKELFEFKGKLYGILAN